MSTGDQVGRETDAARVSGDAGDAGPADPDAFHLLPAIDLRGGSAVRLTRGDFDRETIYDRDPVVVAERFAAAGARWLHVVDLDGARHGAPSQLAVAAEIIAAVGDRMAIQVAGGLRDAAAVAQALDLGASRVVLGTAALADPGLVERLVRRHGAARIAVALDVRAGMAVGEAWREGAPGLPVEAALSAMADVGVGTFAVTAIDRDGAMGGPDIELLVRLRSLGRGRIIASGGIRSVADLRAVRDAGAAGAIVGRALYEGRLDLASAVAALG